MTLREQLLAELRQQNEIAQETIKRLKEQINSEAFARSTVNGGAFASAARDACDKRIQNATQAKNRIEQQNKWISEMLSLYGK